MEKTQSTEENKGTRVNIIPEMAAVKTCGKRCSEFDEDCKDTNQLKCFIGGLCINQFGQVIFLEPVDGFCPYLHNAN